MARMYEVQYVPDVEDGEDPETFSRLRYELDEFFQAKNFAQTLSRNFDIAFLAYVEIGDDEPFPTIEEFGYIQFEGGLIVGREGEVPLPIVKN